MQNPFPLTGQSGVKTQFSPQESQRNLGERMSNAFEQIFGGKSCKRGIILRTDSSRIDATLIENAFDILKREKNVMSDALRMYSFFFYIEMSKTYTTDLFVDMRLEHTRYLSRQWKKIPRKK